MKCAFFLIFFFFLMRSVNWSTTTRRHKRATANNKFQKYNFNVIIYEWKLRCVTFLDSCWFCAGLFNVNIERKNIEMYKSKRRRKKKQLCAAFSTRAPASAVHTPHVYICPTTYFRSFELYHIFWISSTDKYLSLANTAFTFVYVFGTVGALQSGRLSL